MAEDAKPKPEIPVEPLRPLFGEDGILTPEPPALRVYPEGGPTSGEINDVNYEERRAASDMRRYIQSLAVRIANEYRAPAVDDKEVNEKNLHERQVEILLAALVLDSQIVSAIFEAPIDVNVLTAPPVVLAESAIYAEDSAHVSGSDGKFVLAVRNDADTVRTSADGDYSPISVDSAGRAKVVGPLTDAQMRAAPVQTDPSDEVARRIGVVSRASERTGSTRIHKTLGFGTGARTIYTVTAGKTFYMEKASLAARRTTDVLASAILLESPAGTLIEPFVIPGEQVALGALSVLLGPVQSGAVNDSRYYHDDPLPIPGGQAIVFTPSDATDSYAASIDGYEE